MQYGLHRFPNITPSNIFYDIWKYYLKNNQKYFMLLPRITDFVIILIGSSCH